MVYFNLIENLFYGAFINMFCIEILIDRSNSKNVSYEFIHHNNYLQKYNKYI